MASIKDNSSKRSSLITHIVKTKENNATNNDAKFKVAEVNETSMEMDRLTGSGLKYLPKWPAVNIEFQDLSLSVPDLASGKKTILKGVTGRFQSNQLSAILGPSGCGKTTLLNTLAGYKSDAATGQVNINNRPRDMRLFRKMSRYIMQNEVLSPHLTVVEAMGVAADLKLGNDLKKEQKDEVIDEIIDTLRLNKARNTRGLQLSGGEKKRLSIGLELVNNPPVIFLDEPTTGLDDAASVQCIALLQRIAHSGRTIICSIHTPSARIFEMFDHVYVMAEGQCVYQGSSTHIVPYIQEFGLSCPLTYNPADFIIEVVSHEYGTEYNEKMVAAVDNGKSFSWCPHSHHEDTEDSKGSSLLAHSHHEGHTIEQFEEEIDIKQLKSKSSWIQQFAVLLRRMLLEMWRDTNYIKLKFCMTITLGLIVGGLYEGVGNDATKALFNFGFAFGITIAYLYKPMMPVLLQFPTEVRLLKREYFNQWYKLGPYYCAMICAKMPFQIFLALIYLTMIYLMSSQPLELSRIVMLYAVSFLIAMNSDSFGVLIASRLSIVNAMFIGPVLACPMILLSCYGIGFGRGVYIPTYVRVLMSLSYIRHGLEGILAALYGNNRADTFCPDDEVFCMFRKAEFLLNLLGFNNLNYAVSVSALLGYYVFFTVAAYYMIKSRLSFSTCNYAAVQYVSQFVKTHLNFASYKY
ncbi:unnamed protein product [Hermetia illucens]|uniref:ABC transporter domain-containing protein n=1 Tax=Hermetia illucens TaxID=343691 RepID=A0A7R8UDY2_HERIL|nr:ATP-binding cassette sub-family G member 1 [Hermetia illucens]XP_037917259.1 ATP-binding cassette sub-family G member 1 [Hermetia illucens]XP_037917265.1 ATP-binding cassette sub-family G member 1 [Hermetia illucens]CAD7079016.1 unnamed protein product [Hermetia illucens]